MSPAYEEIKHTRVVHRKSRETSMEARRHDATMFFLTADSVAPDSQNKRSPPPRSPPTFDVLTTTIAGLAGIFTIAAVLFCSWTRRDSIMFVVTFRSAISKQNQISPRRTMYGRPHPAAMSTVKATADIEVRGSGQKTRAKSFTSRCTDEIQNVIARSRAVMTRAVLLTTLIYRAFAPPPTRAQQPVPFYWTHASFFPNMTPALSPQTLTLLEKSFDTDS